MQTLEQLAKPEEVQEKEESKVVWTTEKVERTVRAMEEGYVIKDNPFFEGDYNYRRGNIVFEYTDEEYDELKRCAKDIIYFANNYCKVMTDEGYVQIKLRDYQEGVLLSYQKNRQNVFLSCRQSGKCFFYNTNITLKNMETGKIFETTVGNLYNISNKNNTFLSKIKKILYHIVNNI